jgi:glutamate dehydrogenase (NADP+)
MLLNKKIEVPLIDPSQTEFLQAFQEVLLSLKPVFSAGCPVMEAISESERVITFMVPLPDDSGVQRVNRGFKVQFSSAI